MTASASIAPTKKAILLKRGVRHMQLRKAIWEFIEHAKAVRRSPDTIKAYEADLHLLQVHIISEDRDTVLAVTGDRLASFFAKQSAKGYALGTLNRRRSNIASFLKWGVKRRYWLATPMDEVDPLPRSRTLPRPYSKAERERLLALPLSPQENLLRALLYYTGLRVTPISQLRAQDIEMSDGTWRIRSVGKGSKTHVIGVIPELQAAFKGYTFTGVYLFGYEDGTPWKRRAVERRVTLWGLAADVKPCTPHRFRHTLATMLLEKGVPITQISKLLGHADISTTMIYTEVSSQSLDAALMTLSDERTP
jgi:integrase/recombinase XerD